MAGPSIDIRGALDLPPDDAMRAFRARDTLQATIGWRDFEPEEHARAFTVAKVARLDILSDLRESLDRALAEGQTFEAWQAEIRPVLERKGWWGLVQDRSLTGTGRPVFIGDRRLRTIFQTNMRVSRAAGQWARIQALKERRPFLRYSAVQDSRTRPSHMAWHGTVLPVDHPLWQLIFPPNGWNCRCTVTQWSAADLERRGWKVTPDDDLPPLPQRGREWFGRGGGAPRPVFQGVDAGWDYNPGAASLEGLTEKLRASLERAAAAGNETAARETLAQLGTRAIVAQFLAGVAEGLPLAIVSARLGRMLGSTVRVATLSRRSVTHIRSERGRVYSVDVYRAAQRAVDDPLLLVRQGEHHAAVVFAHEGKPYILVLRAEPDKRKLWVSTIFRTNRRDYRRLRRTGEVIVDRLDKLESGAR